jgi:hypothetical protein
MKTTFDIPDAMFRQLKQLSRTENVPMRDLLQIALQWLLSSRAKRPKPFKLEDGSVKGKGLHPDFDPWNWEQIRDAIYEGRGA